ncbi:MAG: MFS transporter [Phycisphaerae bacterium]|nr:MFS transporter [Phycisphaerae bacterium]
MRKARAAPIIEGGERPTRIRYRVVGIATVLAMITYLDRVSISTMADHIMRDLALTKSQMSYVFSAFALAYAAFEVPTAWWADRVGTRRVLARIVIWWSSFTMFTGAAFSYASLIVTRFLFGAGEAGAWPSVARTFAAWIPRQERGRAQGIFFAGAHLAGGFTPLLVITLLRVMNWRTVFGLFGLIGLAWVAIWYAWYRDDPSEHREVNAAERELILANRHVAGSHPTRLQFWLKLFAQRNTIALCVMYFPNSFASYFCMTWLPRYLAERHGLSGAKLGILAGLPLVLSVFGDLLGGATTDYATKRFGLRAGRTVLGASVYTTAGLAMILATVTDAPLLSAGLISLAVAASMFSLAAAWATCIDVAGEHAGVVSAVMNTSGQIGSMLCPIVVIRLVESYGSWNASLYLMGLLFLAGAAAWCVIDPRKRVFA